MRKKKTRNKTLQISLRVSEKELSTIDKRAKSTGKNRSKFLIESATKNEIAVVNFPDAQEIARRLTEVSSAMNKVNVMAHQGKINTVYMDKFEKELAYIWRLLNSLIDQTEVIRE